MSTSARIWLLATLAIVALAAAARTAPVAVNPTELTAMGVTAETGLGTPLSAKEQAGWRQITRNDQTLSLWQATANARAILALAPSRLIAQPQCFPMPRSATLGEHVIELGLLATPWMLATGDPILSYNLALLTTLLAGAAGMFLFVQRAVANPIVASAAAIAFALAPTRFPDALVHPAVQGFHWIPFVLWAFERWVETRRVRDLAAVATFVLLGAVVGGYPLVTLAVVVGPYVALRVATEEDLRSWRTLALLALAALPAAIAVALVVSGYGETARVWVMDRPRPPALAPRGAFFVGGSYFPGVAAIAGLLLLPLGLAAHTRRVAMAMVASLAVVLACFTAGPLWHGGPELPSLYGFLAEWFAPLRSIRAPMRVAQSATILLQLLGLFGWASLLARLRPGIASAVGASLLALVCCETLWSPAASRLFGPLAPIEVVRMAPNDEKIRAVREVLAGDDPGAVLDLPQGRMVRSAPALALAAYHARSTSACYQSLTAVSEPEIALLAERVGRVAGIEEIAAAGFAYIAIHDDIEPAVSLRFDPAPNAELLYRSDALRVYRLPAAPPSHHDDTELRLEIAGGATRAVQERARHELFLEVRNTAARTWAAPPPVQAARAEVTLVDESGREVLRTPGRTLMPLALAPGAARTAALTLEDGPVPGRYRASVRFEDGGLALGPTPVMWTSSYGTRRR